MMQHATALMQGSPSYYCRKICDDGLRCKGDRELSCIKGCMAKFSDVKNILETYEESCPDCKASCPSHNMGMYSK